MFGVIDAKRALSRIAHCLIFSLSFSFPFALTPFQSEVKCLMLQLLSGVKELHDNWVIHRDLKTSNLLLNNKGILKVSGVVSEGSSYRFHSASVSS